MKKIILLGVLVFMLFLISCAPTEEVSDAEIDTELEQMSDEELLDVATVEDADSALAGEAWRRYSKSTKSRYKSAAKKTLSNRIAVRSAPVNIDLSKSAMVDFRKDFLNALENKGEIVLAIGENGMPTISPEATCGGSCGPHGRMCYNGVEYGCFCNC